MGCARREVLNPGCILGLPGPFLKNIKTRPNPQISRLGRFGVGPGFHAVFWILRDSNLQLGLRAFSLELAVDLIWNLKEQPSKLSF